MTFPYGEGGFPQVFPVDKLARPSPRITNRGITEATIAWDAVAGATNYVVLRNGVQVASGNIFEYTFTGLTSGQLNSVQVKAEGGGKESRFATIGITTGRLTRPVLSVVSKTSTTINLASTNPDGMSEVELYQNGELISQGSLFTWGLTGLQADTEYSFAARVGDGEGNWSPMSLVLVVRTDEVIIPVYTPPTLTEVSKTDTTIIVSWDDPDDLELFEVRINGGEAGTSSVTEAEFTGLDADTDYLVEVRAGDGQGNWSPWGSLTVRTNEAEEPAEPSTITMSIDDFQSGIVGPVDLDRDANRVYLMAGGRSAWIGYIDGTEAYVYAGGSASDHNRLLISIDGGAEFLPEVVDPNKFKIFEGAQSRRLVKIRIGNAYGNNSGFPKSGPCLEVTGVDPAIAIPSWLNAFDDTNWITSAVIGSVAGFERQPILRGTTSDNGSSVPTIRFTSENVSEIKVYTHAPTVWYSVDGTIVDKIETGQTVAAGQIVSITGLPAGQHSYNVWLDNSARPSGMGFAVAPDQSLLPLDAIGRMDQYGDSITQSTGDLGRVDTMRAAARLGYAGSTSGVSGNTIADLLTRLPAALAQRIPDDQADVAVLAIGRNDVGSAWDQTKKDNYLAIINLLLAEYKTVLCRGVLPEGSETWPSQNGDIEQIVTALDDPNVIFIDTSEWAGIDTLDGVHPSETGFAQIADYAIPAYADVLGITLGD
ncbi:putative glycosyl hydrolase [Nitrincola phage 1M3-16]|uniref:putative glycosyl hydrolase n=1 Tax=Nitrincola phage 1M3-16 TaxID=1472912 RepID=UPI000444E442|nr:putative glycosyl hydrolase [Nitrincola phage 1M3-16]AHX01171.1 putative glycosyl hydrolase [Nitrincola phage 1M3-16]